MIDRLLASALVHALHPERTVQAAAADLAERATDHPEALDRALALLLRRARERPTALTDRAAQSLRLARSEAGVAMAHPGADLRAPPPRAADLAVG